MTNLFNLLNDLMLMFHQGDCIHSSAVVKLNDRNPKVRGLQSIQAVLAVKTCLTDYTFDFCDY